MLRSWPWVLASGACLLCACGSTNSGGAAGAGGSITDTRSTTLVTDSFVIGAGQEAFKCQIFANPFGESVDVFRTESHMPSGSHHMFAFFEQGATSGSVFDCSGNELDPHLHVAQTPDYVREYPEGVGFRFEASEGLRFSMHWLNTTSQPITAKVELTIVAGAAGSARQQAGFMLLNNQDIQLAPHSSGTAARTCPAPRDVGIVELISHMHQRATHIVAKTGSGRVIYESDDWDHPTPSRFSPPLSLGTDTSITLDLQLRQSGRFRGRVWPLGGNQRDVHPERRIFSRRESAVRLPVSC